MLVIYPICNLQIQAPYCFGVVCYEHCVMNHYYGELAKKSCNYTKRYVDIRHPVEKSKEGKVIHSFTHCSVLFSAGKKRALEEKEALPIQPPTLLSRNCFSSD